jgi:glucose-1-phosphate thymidylyltransferase
MKRQYLKSSDNFDGALIFGYHVNDPERYGVVEYDQNKNVISNEEKPKKPSSTSS